MKNKNITNSREYLTVLLRRRSIVAFFCGILTLALAFLGIIAGVIKTITVLHEDGFVSFIYYRQHRTKRCFGNCRFMI